MVCVLVNIFYSEFSGDFTLILIHLLLLLLGNIYKGFKTWTIVWNLLSFTTWLKTLFQGQWIVDLLILVSAAPSLMDISILQILYLALKSLVTLKWWYQLLHLFRFKQFFSLSTRLHTYLCCSVPSLYHYTCCLHIMVWSTYWYKPHDVPNKIKSHPYLDGLPAGLTQVWNTGPTNDSEIPISHEYS